MTPPRSTLIALALIAMPLAAAPLPDVQQASQSVYRIWLGIPLPTGFVKQTDGSHIQSLQTQAFAEQVPLTGMSLLNKKSGKLKPLSGEGMLFQHNGKNYLLVANGSAYAVSDKGHLVTNAKLADNVGDTQAVFVDETGLRDMGDNGGKAEAFILTKPADTSAFKLHPTKQIVRDVKTDLAVVHAESLPTKGLKLADSQFAKSADLVFALGAEGAFDPLSGKQGAIDRVDYTAAIASEGKLDKRVKQKETGLWLHSAPISGSQTGGALVNQCGQVLGTNQLNEVNGAFAAIDAGELLPMLRKHSIPFQTFQGRCGNMLAKAENAVDKAEAVLRSAEHNPRGWLSVLGLGVLGLVAAVIAWKGLAWTLRQRRQTVRGTPQAANRQPAPATPPVQQPNYAPNPPAQTPAAAYTPPPVPPTYVPPTPPVAAPKTSYDHLAIVLQGVSGSLNALAVPSNRVITVGRAADCDVVLPNPQISGKHLKLWQDNGAVWVQDLNSSNGTFVNGAKIHAATRLAVGDMVQLTSDVNIARFRLPETSAAAHTVVHTPPTIHIPTHTWHLKPMQQDLPPIAVPAQGRIAIGQASDNDVVIANQYVSRKHAHLRVENGVLWLIDVGSKNGTFVDTLSNRVQETPLQAGQTVYFANQSVQYRVEKV